jgi:hypothetical protein
MPDGMRELGPPGGLEVREQVKVAAVIGPVAQAA